MTRSLINTSIRSPPSGSFHSNAFDSKIQLAAQILDACAFLQPDAIPTIFFENQSAIFSSPAADEHSKRVVRAAIAVLIEFSFLKPTRTERENNEGDPSKDMLAIHRLVQTVICDSIDNERRLRWFQRLATAFRGEIGDPDYYNLQDRDIMDVYLPHIRHFIAQLVDFDPNRSLTYTDDLEDVAEASSGIP